MALIRTCRSAARSGRARFLPGGPAHAAARQLLFPQMSLQVSSALKLAPGFSHKPTLRLAPAPA